MTPDQVELKPPAKKPYNMENTVSRANVVWDEPSPEEAAIPQKRNTDKADPSEEINTIFVTAKRSQSMPIVIPPKTEVALKSETSIVPIVAGSPIVVVE